MVMLIALLIVYVVNVSADPRKRSPGSMYCSDEEGGGFQYQTSCYHVITEMKSWENAEKHCKYYHNGHLLTILDRFEDQFLDRAIIDIRKALWIGIKIQNQKQQNWTSGWYVTYNAFNEDEIFEEGTCVARRSSDEWVTIPCNKELPFICQVSKAVSYSVDLYGSKTSEEYVPCDSGWYYFRNKCYKVVPQKARYRRYTWPEALQLCRDYGGDLASIQSQEEQDFIITYLQPDDRDDWTLWIGLNDRDRKGDFRWNDGSVFNYTNLFTKSRLTSERENCVQMIFEKPFHAVGEWNVSACETHRTYAACEKNTNAAKRSPNLIYCSPEEGGGWRHKSSCYHIVTEKKTWQEAEKHCKTNFQGHLLTIRDKLEDLFLELALPDTHNEIWIGIEIQAQLQQKWTSGWYVSYDKSNYRGKYVEGTCVARRSRTEWIAISCSIQLPFICEVSKATPPTLKPPLTGSYCPKEFDGWRDLGGNYCYYIRYNSYNSSRSFNFNEANFDCLRKGGNLLSLHSQEEANMLHSFLKYEGHNFLIGLIRLNAITEEMFGWSDGSVLDYQNWGLNEPDRLEEKCVEANALKMDWKDCACDQKFDGYICSVKKVMPKSKKNPGCINYCITPYSYLHGLLSQSPDANQIS